MLFILDNIKKDFVILYICIFIIVNIINLVGNWLSFCCYFFIGNIKLYVLFNIFFVLVIIIIIINLYSKI